MDPHHRKVDLQSPADLLYLQSNIQTAAQQKLDLAIPPQGEDAFRSKVQELVHEVLYFRLPTFPFPD
jgi:kinetochor protein Mis14/NSL1